MSDVEVCVLCEGWGVGQRAERRLVKAVNSTRGAALRYRGGPPPQELGSDRQ